MFNKEQIEKVVREYANEVIKKLDPKSIVLYRSYAIGTQKQIVILMLLLFMMDLRAIG
ncbi:MAG: hypothetical protein FWE03_04525 [Firmicutes bacterium]|nr:hypothetical protein [Bacillota bacterium]